MKRFLSITLLFFLFQPALFSQRSRGFYGRDAKKNSPTITVPTVLKEKKSGLFGSPMPGLRTIMLTAFGPAYLFGDIGGSLKSQALFGLNDLDLSKTRYMFSMGMRHIFTNNFSVKATLYQGIFAGSDEHSRNNARGISYTSNILEATAQGEYVFLGGPNARPRVPYTFYAFAGFGYINSNISIKGNIDQLTHPTVNSITAPVAPVGLGYQHKISENIYLGGEIGWHYIFSDYADGIHTDESKNNDVIAIATFTFTYKLYEVASKKKSCNCNN